MNISATLNVFRLIRDPALCLPHSTIPNFNYLPIPLSNAFKKGEKGHDPDIRAVVLDKDNCFAKPKQNTIYEPYNQKFAALRQAYPGSRLLIISNSAGSGDDPDGIDAEVLEKATGVTVLQHCTKKPGCGVEVLSYFRNTPELGTIKPSQIAIVGDRLFTDVMMANMMGSWSVWIKDGVVKEKGLFNRIEGRLANFLLRKGYSPSIPSSVFE